MSAQTAVTRSVERRVVDNRSLRSRPQTMRVSLPYVRALDADDAPALSTDMRDDPDRAASAPRGRETY